MAAMSSASERVPLASKHRPAENIASHPLGLIVFAVAYDGVLGAAELKLIASRLSRAIVRAFVADGLMSHDDAYGA
jgi:hypothetical protein